MSLSVLPYGDRAVLVEDPPGGPTSWAVGLQRLDGADMIEVVPAARTVLVRCLDASHLGVVVDRFPDVRPVRFDDAAETIDIPVRYDGEDLADVAHQAGMTPPEVVALHSDASYRVAFCGFAPGFAYLEGLPPRLHLPRRPTPRTRVPAGSVAIAAQYSAVYPTNSPGGWHLLGTTDVATFNVDRTPPALLRPGVHVRFNPVS